MIKKIGNSNRINKNLNNDADKNDEDNKNEKDDRDKKDDRDENDDRDDKYDKYDKYDKSDKDDKDDKDDKGDKNELESFSKIKKVFPVKESVPLLEILRLNSSSNEISINKTDMTDKISSKIIEGDSIPLAEIPFVYVPNDFVIKQKQYYYETTRGCPFNCSYCLSSVTQTVDILPVERVKKEMRFFIDQDVKQIKLVDRTFNFDDKRAIEIWSFLIDEYKKEPFQTNFHFEIAADLLSQESLLLLQAAPKGLFQFEIGVQTTNETVLANINRKSFLNKVFENVIKLKLNGNISLHLDLIAGLPGEDWNSFAHSFHQVFSLKPDMLQLGFLKVLKGSPIRSEAKKRGVIYSNIAPYEVLASDLMTFQELLRLKKFEILLDRYYNSNLFYYSLEFIVKYFQNSFQFFELFEKHWSKKDLFKRNVSRQDVIREFYLFIHETLINMYFENNDHIYEETEKLFLDLLKFDYYRFDKKGNVDELDINLGLHHPELPRDQEKPSWYQINGQPVCEKPRLEKYTFNAKVLIDYNIIIKQSSYILYEMIGNKPIVFDILIL